MDSIVLKRDEFLEMNNFNEANAMSDDSSAFNQTYTVTITNNFENFKFDVLVFEVDDDTQTSKDYECYKQAVFAKKWNTDCKFG